MPYACYLRLVIWGREATLQVDLDDRSMSPTHSRPDP